MSKEAKERESEEKDLTEKKDQVDKKSETVSDEEMYVYEAFIAEQGY